MRAEADVFCIFDCCHAGLLERSQTRGRLGPSQNMRYLLACSEDKTTRRAGEESFTSALIWALQGLARESPFSVERLKIQLCKAPKFPKDQYPHLSARFGVTKEPISIVSKLLKSEPAVDLGQYRDVQRNRHGDFLDLRLDLGRKVTLADIPDICRALKSIKSQLDYRSIDLVGKHNDKYYSKLVAATETIIESIRKRKRDDDSPKGSEVLDQATEPPADLFSNLTPASTPTPAPDTSDIPSDSESSERPNPNVCTSSPDNRC